MAALLLLAGTFTGIGAKAATSSDAFDPNASTTESMRNSLQRQIELRAKDLERVNQELVQSQKTLNETQTQKTGLQKELNNIQYNTNQLKLNIQSDEITIQKLSLEIKTLQFDIQDINASTKDKRAAIAQIFRELQRAGDRSFLITFLKSASLADSVMQAQSLNDLNSKLSVDVETLKGLHEELTKKVSESNNKKAQTDQHQANLQNRKVILQEQQTERQTLLTQTKNKETVYAKQVADLKKLQEDIAAEIEAIDAELRANIDPNLLPSAKPGVLLWPVSGGRLTQGYGATDFALQAYAGKRHNGIDIGGLALGAEIYAAEDGTVINTGDQDKFCYKGAYGKFAVIKHQNGLTTLYAHLSRIGTSIGQEVKRGDVIGYLGKTGYATGPHLHFTVFATQTIPQGTSPEGTKPSRSCGPMPVGGDISPLRYLDSSRVSAAR